MPCFFRPEFTVCISTSLFAVALLILVYFPCWHNEHSFILITVKSSYQHFPNGGSTVKSALKVICVALAAQWGQITARVQGTLVCLFSMPEQVLLVSVCLKTFHFRNYIYSTVFIYVYSYMQLYIEMLHLSKSLCVLHKFSYVQSHTQTFRVIVLRDAI